MPVSKWTRRSVERPAAEACRLRREHLRVCLIMGCHHCHVKTACLVQQQAGTPWVGSVVTPKDSSRLPGWYASLENERSAFPGEMINSLPTMCSGATPGRRQIWKYISLLKCHKLAYQYERIKIRFYQFSHPFWLNLNFKSESSIFQYFFSLLMELEQVVKPHTVSMSLSQTLLLPLYSRCADPSSYGPTPLKSEPKQLFHHRRCFSCVIGHSSTMSLIQHHLFIKMKSSSQSEMGH